jgi:hypothetical protein
MDALRNSKKISLLAVAILFLFTFFNLILDAPRTCDGGDSLYCCLWDMVCHEPTHQVP